MCASPLSNDPCARPTESPECLRVRVQYNTVRLYVFKTRIYTLNNRFTRAHGLRGHLDDGHECRPLDAESTLVLISLNRLSHSLPSLPSDTRYPSYCQSHTHAHVHRAPDRSKPRPAARSISIRSQSKSFVHVHARSTQCTCGTAPNCILQCSCRCQMVLLRILDMQIASSTSQPA